MTNEELAAHWNVPLSEVESISDFMNKNYYTCVGKNKNDGLFYGLMFRIDERHGPMLSLSTSKGFETPKEAGDFFNKACDTIEMPNLRAELLGVPVDAYKAIKKIDTSVYATQEKTQFPSLGRGARD